MRPQPRILICTALLILALASNCYAAGVSVTETVRSISTHAYEQGLYLPLPRDNVNGYPYPNLKLYKVAKTTTPRNYRSVVLENDYLKLTILPDLGGRIVEMIYKPTGQNVFYENEPFRPNYYGEQGWWIATGGMEFCFPLKEHSTNILQPWIYSVEKSSDGSATVTVSDTHESTGLTESVGITLHPNSCNVGLHMRLTNPGAESKQFLFWINAMLPANDDVELIVPTDKVKSWDGVPRDWPILEGKDISKLANWSGPNALFAIGLHAGYAGMYDHSRNIGLVRSFPFPSDCGTKLYSFGHTKESLFVPGSYTDTGKPYFEFWGGYSPTFWDRSTIASHEVVEWNEDWYPVSATDGFRIASAEMAVNAKKDKDHINVAFFPSRDIKQARIAIRSGSTNLWVGTQDFQCGKALTKTFQLRPNAKPLQVKVSEGSRVVLSGLVEQPKQRVAKSIPVTKPDSSISQNNTPKQKTVGELVEADQMDEAVKLYESDASARPGGAADYCLALVRKDRVDDALDCLKRIKPHASRSYLIGTLLLRKGDTNAARSTFEAALRANPKDANTLVALGAVSSGEERSKLLRSALSMDPNNLVALAEMADLGDKQSGSRLQAALQNGAQNAVYISLGYLELNVLSKAESYAREALEIEPSNVTAMTALAVAQLRGGKPVAADETLRKLRDVELEKAILYASDSSVMEMEEALSARPKDARLMLYLAMAYEIRRSEDAAIEMAKRSAEIEPDVPRVQFLQAQLLYWKGRDSDDPQLARQSAELLDKCLALNPTAYPDLLFASQIYREGRRHFAANSALQRLIALYPDWDMAHKTRGRIALEDEHNYQAAIGWYKLDPEAVPDTVNAYAVWMRHLVYTHELDKLARVHEDYEASLKMDEDKFGFADTEIYDIDARALEALGRHTEARKILEKIKSQKTDLLENRWAFEWNYLAGALDQLGEKDEARKIWTKCKTELEPIVQKYPDWDGGIYLLASAQYKLGQTKDALVTFDKMSKSRKNSEEYQATYQEILSANNSK